MNTSITNNNKQLKLKLLCGLIFFVFLLPYFLFGEDVRIWTHDNLDSVLIY